VPAPAADDAVELLTQAQLGKLALLLGEQQSIFAAARMNGSLLALPEDDTHEASLVALVARAYDDGVAFRYDLPEASGLGDAPWPPHFPKTPGEAPRVAPSRAKKGEKRRQKVPRKLNP